jgi:hypothetical protein
MSTSTPSTGITEASLKSAIETRLEATYVELIDESGNVVL